MAHAGNDNEGLLSSDAEVGGLSQSQRSAFPKKAALLFGVGALSLTAVWKTTSRPQTASKFDVDNVMSAVIYLNPFKNTDCESIWRETNWPHIFQEVNWKGHCSDRTHNWQCQDRLVEKFVGDYFDRFLLSIDRDEHGYGFDQHFIPIEVEQINWKARVVQRMQEWDKSLGLRFRRHKPVEWAPGRSVDYPHGLVCQAIYEERPIVPVTLAQGVTNGCRADYTPWHELQPYFGTASPANWSYLCDDVPCVSAFDHDLTKIELPGEYGFAQNPNLENCRHLLSEKVEGPDWIHSSLSVLDMRLCLAIGETQRYKFSRSWVRSCIPFAPIHDPRHEGWPGWVYDFIREYGLVTEECIPDYNDRVDWTKCPSHCEDGGSLLHNLRWFDEHEDFGVIFHPNLQGVPYGTKYKELAPYHVHQAKAHIYTEGPIVGLVLKSIALAACANSDVIIFEHFADSNNTCGDLWDGEFNNLHSVVVHGYGSSTYGYKTDNLRGRDHHFWRIWSSAFQTEDHDVRIAECMVKAFVIPPDVKKLTGHYSKFFDDPRRCPRPRDFCREGGHGGGYGEDSGYTHTEDCDGDEILDHYCYRDGIETFISSVDSCQEVQSPCRRKVLPGVAFGCQRPLGWCMNGETYRRDRDCDGDGNYDHECDRVDANGQVRGGFISSANKCTDTWAEARRCQPRVLAAQNYKFVKLSGENCVEHESPICYQSHVDWPYEKYAAHDHCKLQVQWTHTAPQQVPTGCVAPLPEERLFVEVMSLDLEKASYTSNGLFRYGDQLQVGSINVLTGNFSHLYAVGDRTEVTWLADRSIERNGWLICLRVKHKIPQVYNATCDELGSDLYNKLDISDRQSVRIQCEECVWEPVTALYVYVDTFSLTRPICDAGMQVRGKANFLFTYHEAWNTEEPRFQISH